MIGLCHLFALEAYGQPFAIKAYGRSPTLDSMFGITARSEVEGPFGDRYPVSRYYYEVLDACPLRMRS